MLNGAFLCSQLNLSGTWNGADRESDCDMAFAMLRHAPGVKHLIIVHALYGGATIDRDVCPQPRHCLYKILPARLCIMQEFSIRHVYILSALPAPF